VTDGVRGSNFANQVNNGNANSVTTFGQHTYQIAANFTDINGISGTITSSPQQVNILVNDQTTATGILIPNAATSSGINVVYQVTKNDDQIDNVKVRYTNIATSTIAFEENRGTTLFGTSTATNLTANSEYLVQLVVMINGQEVVLDAKTIATPPTAITEGNVFVDIRPNFVNHNSVEIAVSFFGNPTDLQNIDASAITLSRSQIFGGTVTQVIDITAQELAQLQNRETVFITVDNLNPLTTYDANLTITGSNLDPFSNATMRFFTSELPTSALAPTFSSTTFTQKVSTPKEAMVTAD